MNNHVRERSDDQPDIEGAVRTIREKIRIRQMSGEFPPEISEIPDSSLSPQPGGTFEESTRTDRVFVNARWDLHNDSYVITSHLPGIGNMLVRGRQLVHGEVRRYVDPLLSQQSALNAGFVRILNLTAQKCIELEERCTGLAEYCSQLERQCADLGERLKSLDNTMYAGQQSLDRKISRCIDMVDTEIESKIDDRIGDHLSSMDGDIRQRAWLAHVLDERVLTGLSRKDTAPGAVSPADLNYFLFEERFRGSRESIRNQQMEFLPLFKTCSRVLDIGCGRGEFLEILREHQVEGIGIDIDPDMVRFCLSRGLNVERADAIPFLECQEDDSIDGIFIDQVVEHLEPEYLVRMLAACFRKLRNGGIIVAETVNPLSLASFVNFYLDPSHLKPVHPLTLKFLMESAGFSQNEVRFYSPIPDFLKLQKLRIEERSEETWKESATTFNSNIELLNNLLWGPRDYAIIGRKTTDR